GVNARDTAERETPARLATSAAVTNAPRPCSVTPYPPCTRVQKSYPALHACATSKVKVLAPRSAALRDASRRSAGPLGRAGNGNARHVRQSLPAPAVPPDSARARTRTGDAAGTPSAGRALREPHRQSP